MQTVYDSSFGIIPVYRNETGHLEVLVIHQYGSKGDTYWGFPKGHAEEGETPLQAARRELAEETSITDIDIDAGYTFEQRYQFIHNSTRIKKTVTYFVGVAAERDLTLEAKELKDAKWCSLPDARDRLTHDGTKRMFDEVVAYLGEK